MSSTTIQPTPTSAQSSGGGAAPLNTPGVNGATSSPSIYNRVANAASQLWQGFKGYSSTTKVAAGITEKAVRISEQVAYYGIVSFDEFFDFANFGGTKDPSASIEKSRQRLRAHDPSFEESLNFIADQVTQYLVKNQEQIKEKLSQDQGSLVATIIDMFYGEIAGSVVKANLLHIAANLADEGFDGNYLFADRRQNPFGRILSVIGNCLASYEDRLDAIEQLPEDEQTAQYQILFKEMSSELLAKLFPHGAEDIQLFQLFSGTIPIKWVKGIVWDKINEALPLLLERCYKETRPLAQEHEDWKELFDEVANGPEADQLLELPSTLIQRFVREDRSRILDAQLPALEKLLKENGVEKSQAREFSRILVNYGKEFLQTEEPALLAMGAFCERYLMEHLLFNLSQFVPIDQAEETPLFLYILQQWIKGDVFEMLSSKLSGTVLTNEDKKNATEELLAPFGLNREESFPLPPMIKKVAWPFIQEWLQANLVDSILELLPKWMGQREKYQSKMDTWLDDPSLVKTLRNLSGACVEKGINQLNQPDFSLTQHLNEWFPELVLSDDQQASLEEQWKKLLGENDSINLLTNFGQQCVEALALQLYHDLYQRYQEENALDGLRLLFDDPAENEDETGDENESEISSPSFSAWLMSEVTTACDALTMNNLTPREVQDLQKAVELKNAIRDAVDTDQVGQDQAELNHLWINIQPKFVYLSSHLLEILGYRTASDLPFPDKFQAVIWKMLNEKMPAILFEQVSDLMLPILKKKELGQQVKALPEGTLIQKGCQDLAKDIVKHLPDWLEGTIETLPEMLMDDQSGVDLSDKAQDYLVQMTKEMLNAEDPAYQPLWQWIESYLEGMFLKVALSLSQMNKQDLLKIRTLAQQTKEKLLALEELEETDELEEDEVDEIKEEEISDSLEEPETADAILVQFTDKLFDWLGIETSQALFGVPQVVQEPLLTKLKAKMAQGLLGIYHLDYKVRHHVVQSNPVEDELPTSKVAQATLALTRYTLDKATDKLTTRVDGKPQVINDIYDPLNLWLDKQATEGYQIAQLAQEVIARDIPTPFFVNLFDLLNTASAQSYKQKFVDWVNPVLTDQVIHYLTPLLKREQEEQAAFDQALLMSLLPVITRHLKHLNAASRSVDGLNFANFVDVAGDEIHPAVPLTQEEDEEKQTEQRQDNFYKPQVDLIFQLIFPHGQEDLKEILPELELSDEKSDLAMESAKKMVAAQLPKVLESLFDREMLVELFTALFEDVLENLDEPIEIKSTKKEPPPLTKAEKVRQREMDKAVGELLIEAARFIDLPVDFFEKLPSWVKKVTGMNSMKKSTYESIGAAMREQFNGDLLLTTLQKQLTKMANKKHVHLTEKENGKAKIKGEKDLKELERKLAERSLAFIFRYLGKRFEEATDIFRNPTIDQMREAIFDVCSFVMINIVGSLLRFFKIEDFVINRLYGIIAHATDKSLNVFSQKELHEDVVYHGVEAFENVLLNEPS